MVIEHLVGVQPVDLQHLRDNLVGPAGDREVVDVSSPQRGAQCRADILLRKPERGDEIAIDFDGGLRLVQLEIGVDVKEHAAGLRFLQDRLGDLVQVRVRLGGLDDELHGQALRSGQRRKLKCSDARAGDAVPLLLQLLLQLRGAFRALVPWLEQHTADPLIGRRHAGDLEHLIVLRKLARNVEHLLGIGIHLL